MLQVPKIINFNQTLLKNLDNEDDKNPTNENIFEVKNENLAIAIATFEGVIKHLDETPEAACILTCAYCLPSIYTLQIINEYYSTKRVLLTCKKDGNDLKLLTNQVSRKLHDDFANIDFKTPEEFEFQCKQKLKYRVNDIKKLHSFYLKNAKANDYLVSLLFTVFKNSISDIELI